MKRILSLSRDLELTLLRRRLLESAGYTVVAPLTDTAALEAVSEKDRFDVCIVCYRMWPGTARHLMRVFRENNPSGQFLIMVRVYGEVPELEGDRYVVGANGPDALIAVLNEMTDSSLNADALGA